MKRPSREASEKPCFFRAVFKSSIIWSVVWRVFFLRARSYYFDAFITRAPGVIWEKSPPRTAVAPSRDAWSGRETWQLLRDPQSCCNERFMIANWSHFV